MSVCLRVLFFLLSIHPSSIRPSTHAPARICNRTHTTRIANVQLFYSILWGQFRCRNRNLWTELLGHCCAAPLGFPATLFADSRQKLMSKGMPGLSSTWVCPQTSTVLPWFRINWQDLCIGSHRNTTNDSWSSPNPNVVWKDSSSKTFFKVSFSSDFIDFIKIIKCCYQFTKFIPNHPHFRAKCTFFRNTTAPISKSVPTARSFQRTSSMVLWPGPWHPWPWIFRGLHVIPYVCPYIYIYAYIYMVSDWHW